MSEPTAERAQPAGDRDSEVFWSLGITPVQQWIAEARRSRDLLAGSAILSWLMARLLAVLREHGARVELPALGGADLEPYAEELSGLIGRTVYGIPNRASGRMPGTPASAEEVLRDLERKLVDGWESVRRKVETDARRSAGKVWDLVGEAVREAACPFQLTWCVEGAESSNLQKIDRLYAAVKRGRRIVSHHGLPVPKCSQCGRREAAGGPRPGEWKRVQERLSALRDVERGLRIESQERLCGVCLTKRFAGYLRGEPFPSTSAIAARTWRRRVEESLPEDLSALEESIRAVPGYEERWADIAPLYYRRTLEAELRRAREAGDTGKVASLEAVGKRQAALRRQIEEGNRSRTLPLAPAPPQYLAVLTFDGDDMGRHVREALVVLPGRVAAFQKALADRFAGGGTEPPGTVDPLGSASPFYLGGDEGLLMAPAAAVLDVATAIRGLWEREVEEVGERAEGDAPTLSVGAAIFDRERPLGPAIEAAQAALARAKELRWPGGRKDALGVTVITASGSRWTAVERWGAGWDRARMAVHLIGADRLSAGWPHDVERFLRSLDLEEALAAGEDARSAIRAEVERLTVRRTPRKQGSEAREAERELPWSALRGEEWWLEQPSPEERKAVADQLHLVAFLVRSTGGGRDAA